MDIAFCLLCVNPDYKQVLYYSELTRYGLDVFVLADSNRTVSHYPSRTKLLQIDDKECIMNGFHHFNPTIKHKRTCSAWDKGLYSFSRKLLQYDYVWFAEEDVFIPQLEALAAIQIHYPAHDLVLGPGGVLRTDESLAGNRWGHWSKLPSLIRSPPYAFGMCCICRVSRALLECIGHFVETYNKLLPVDFLSYDFKRLVAEHGVPFIEFILPTLAEQNSLNLIRPVEIVNTVMAPIKLARKIADGQWDPRKAENYEPNLIYHPVKDLSLQNQLRQQMSQ